MRVIAFISLVCFALNLHAQTKNSEERAKVYRSETWKATNYINFLTSLTNNLNFKPVGILKGQDSNAIKTVLLSLSEEEIKQLNITGEYYCSVRHDESHLLWEIKYFKVPKDIWDKYCKAFVALMEIDGTLRK